MSRSRLLFPVLGTELIEGAPQAHYQEHHQRGGTRIERPYLRHTTQLFSHQGIGHPYREGRIFLLYDNHWNDGAVVPQRGSYSFTGQYSGVGYADFLLGYPSATSKPTPNNFITRNISAQYGFYLQDDWKATPRLTINAGIRYDLQWFRPSPYGNASLYIPSLQYVVVFGSGYPPSNAPFRLSLPS